MLCSIYSSLGIRQTLVIYNTWLVETIFFLIVLAKSLAICFALATICFFSTFWPIQVPKKRTTSFSLFAYTSCLSTITLRSSTLVLVLIAISLDLDEFIWISLNLKNSSTTLIVFSSYFFELAIHVVSSAKATTACLIFCDLLLFQ